MFSQSNNKIKNFNHPKQQQCKSLKQEQIKHKHYLLVDSLIKEKKKPILTTTNPTKCES